jgi:hypothetical protein
VIKKFHFREAVCVFLLIPFLMQSVVFAAGVTVSADPASNSDQTSNSEQWYWPEAAHKPSHEVDLKNATAKKEHLDFVYPFLAEQYAGLMQKALDHDEKVQMATNRGLQVPTLDYMLLRGRFIWINTVGKGELRRTSGGVFFAKVVDKQTHDAYLIFDEQSLPTDPLERKQFKDELDFMVKDQHINGGNSRADGEQGRNVIGLALNEGSFFSKDFPKEKPTWQNRARVISEWIKVTLVPADKGDFKLGLFSGLLQGVEIIAFEQMRLMEQVGSQPHWGATVAMAAFTAAFGLGIGWKLNAYRKFVNRPIGDLVAENYKGKIGKLAKLASPPAKRFYKSSLVSAAYLYPVLYGKADHRLGWATFFTITGSIAFSVAVGYFGKNPVNMANQISDYVNESTESFKVGKYDVGIGEDKVWNQIRAQFPMLLKFSDIMGFTPSSKFSVGSQVFTIPVASIAMIKPINISVWMWARYLADKLMADPYSREKGEYLDRLALKLYEEIFHVPFIKGDFRQASYEGTTLNDIAVKFAKHDMYDEPKEFPSRVVGLFKNNFDHVRSITRSCKDALLHSDKPTILDLH